MSDKPDCVIVLAAGKGSRMGSESRHKVCFEIDGVPAVVRALDVYRKCGIAQNLVVVGSLAGQVVETVGRRFPNTVFAYQSIQNGTAGAVRAALAATPDMPPDAELLIVAGDRLIDPAVLEQLFDLYNSGKCDLAMLSLPTVPGSGAGRLAAAPDGRVAAILEMADVRKKKTIRAIRAAAQKNGSVDREAIRTIAAEIFSSDEAKCRRALGAVFDTGKTLGSDELRREWPPESEKFRIAMPDGSSAEYTPEEVEKFPYSNTSVYITRRRHLELALTKLDTGNAQQEEYLSDIAAILNRELPAAVIRRLAVNDPDKVLGFNNPRELMEVAAAVRRQSSGEPVRIDSGAFIPAGEYAAKITEAAAGKDVPVLTPELATLYGEDKNWTAEHLKLYLPLLELAVKELGPDAPLALIRAPGRVNVMGRHVDHQGGNCNLMTINFETLMAVSPRNDDTVRLVHVDKEKFSPCEFSISAMLKELPWEDWQSVVDSRELKNLIGEYGVDWSHYVKAAVLRLQKKFNSRPLRGMNLFVTGNIPMAAGLSSSSSLVVGAAEAVTAVNALDTFPAQLVTLCGEGEWFVGTRGGAADHAAVKLGAKGKVIKVGFFDFKVEDSFDFPEDCVMALCDSGIKARKAAGVRDQFNLKVCCYKLGFLLLLKQFPRYRGLLSHLRDVNCDNLAIPPAGIYRMLLRLPEYSTRPELESLLGDKLDRLWATHAEPADRRYPIRPVVMYGLAECARSKKYAALVKAGDLDAIGRLMRASHDGDRVAKLGADGKMHPYFSPCGNDRLLDLIDALASGDPAAVTAAQLEFQPGGYRCSLPEIDMMTDIANAVPGVIGSQLAGAGLGGCMMVLTRKNAADALFDAMNKRYYAPRGAAPAILFCRPIAGAGMLKVR
ncbi:MAG: NTP transferase domain-containing protein [Victivallaceae bacterium]|nr:NTP transferase domain-containing protein [Victivallaceae bacterium]